MIVLYLMCIFGSSLIIHMAGVTVRELSTGYNMVEMISVVVVVLTLVYGVALPIVLLINHLI